MYTELKNIAERVKYLREVMNVSVEEAGAVVGLSPEEYIKAEEGKYDFTFSFLQKLAKYFSVDIVELISGDCPKLNGFQIVRCGNGMPLERRKGFKYLHLASLFKDKHAEPFMVTAKYNEAEKDKTLPLSTHNDQEFNLIIKGALKFKVGEYETVLNVGDSAYYNANIPHGMSAYGEDCEFLSVVIKNRPEEGELIEHVSPEAIALDKDRNAIYRRFITPTLDNKGKLVKIDFHPENNFNFAYDVVDAIAKKSPTKPAMLWVSAKKEEKLFTFKDMAEGSNRTANFFSKAGIKKGDKVLVVLKRHYQFWYTILALHKLGAVAVPATHLLTEHDLSYRFNKAGISAVIMTADGPVSDECEKALKVSPTVTTKIRVGAPRDGWLDFDEGVRNASAELERVETSIDDTSLMYFTSGTTGYPKIAMHSQRYALGHFVTAKYWHNVDPDGMHFTIADTGWGKAVWGKLYGQWLSESAIFTYDFDKFEASDILPMFARYNITTFCAPPTMYRFFIKDDLSKYDLSSLKYATTAGEALNLEVYEQFLKATGLKVMEGFGQTETTLVLGNLVGSDIKPGSMGKPTPQFDADIINEKGTSCDTGEVGEIVIRTDKETPYGLFKGYYLDEAATKAAWHDGIYHTGDMAWKDEDGFYWYVGRIDDVIKSSGYRIGPFEVESVLMELPYILECAITGVPHPTRGQVVKATIVLVKDKEPTEELKSEIQTYVKKNTAPYKYPRVIEFVDELPKTISGKIMRKDLRK